MIDQYEVLVGEAVSAVRSGDEGRVVAAVNAFAELGAAELIAELCNWLEDCVRGYNIKTLLRATTLPVPERPEVLLKAVKRNSLPGLFKFAKGDLTVLISSMLALIAALQDAAERTPRAG